MGFFDKFFGRFSDRRQSYRYRRDYRMLFRCPACGSGDVSTERKGFNWNDAFMGNMIFGQNGWLMGFHDKGRIEHKCRNCGYTWSDS